MQQAEQIVNDKILKLTGGFSITDDLELDTEYILLAPIEIYDAGGMSSNQDGTYDLKYRGKICGEAKLTKGDKVIYGSKKGSQSQVFRYIVRQYADEKGEDKDLYYTFAMNKLLSVIKNDPDKLDDFLRSV